MVRLIAGTQRPRLLLACVALGLYATSLRHPFFVDDYRNLRLMREYQAGRSERLRLYEFVLGGGDTRAQRLSGLLPWWAADDLRFTYFRPLSEAVLYAEYRVFGARAAGFRAVGLTLYLVGIWLALALYRTWTGDEELSRWAALIFAVASCNAVTVTFIAAQCDLLALVLCLTAMLAAARFVERGAAGWFAAAVAAYAAGLLAKEAAVPAAILPLGLTWLLRPPSAEPTRRLHLRRAAAVTAAFCALGLALVGYYGIYRFGSNGVLMLNPLTDPANYLWAMPGRVLVLLASWLMHVNPFLTYVRGPSLPLSIAYCVVGVAALAYAARELRRCCRGDRRLRAMLLWAAAFLPLLACTNPDNRIMMLPMVGLALVGALWMLDRSTDLSRAAGGPGGDVLKADFTAAATRLRRVPTALLLFVPLPICTLTSSAMQMLEKNARENLGAAAGDFGRSTRADDCVFFFNTPYQFDLLWCQDRADFVLPVPVPRVRYLSHVPDVRIEVLGPRGLRLHATQIPFFAPFMGQAAMTRPTIAPGTRFDAGEFTAVVRDVSRGEVRAVDFEFMEPLDSPRYAFFRLNATIPPQHWRPGARDE